MDEVDTSACETSKACFRVPDGCTANCDYILTWTNVDQAVSFEMSASASSNNYWVSFGLSHDQKMVEIIRSIRVYVHSDKYRHFHCRYRPLVHLCHMY